MHCLLDQPVQRRRNAQLAHPAAGLGNLNAKHSLGPVAVFQQFCFDLRPVGLAIVPQLFDIHAVDTSSALVGTHALISRNHILTSDHRFHHTALLRKAVPARCRDAARTTGLLSGMLSPTLGRGGTRLRAPFCGYLRHRNDRLPCQTTCSGLQSGRWTYYALG